MRRRERIFWLVVGAICVVGFIALIPAHGEICKESQKTGEEACASYGLLSFLLVKIGQALDALGVAITALATIAIAWFTWSLWRSTDKLWSAGENQRILSEKIGRQQLRAYIDVQRATIADFEKGKIASVEVRLKNSGQTPAHEVRTMVRIKFAPVTRFEEILTIDFNRTGGSIGTVGAGGKVLLHIRLSGELEDVHIGAVEGKKAAIYVFGVVNYKDIFDQPHENRFYLEYAGRNVTAGTNKLQPCREGNVST